MSVTEDVNALSALKEKLQAAPKIEADLAMACAPLLAERLDDPINDDDISARLIANTDSALAMVGTAFPDWAVSLEGATNASGDAQWVCRFCKSRGDDEQLVGVGHGAGIRLALLAAVTHLSLMRAQGYA
ncbi:MAG: hypothetical protein AAF940_04095 [Pseudomonadota bacterium]